MTRVPTAAASQTSGSSKTKGSAALTNPCTETRQERATPRKHTKFVTCPKHRWLKTVTLPGTLIVSRQRRAQMFMEGGPGGEDEYCEGGRCRIWPGTLFVTDICHGE